MLSDLTYHITDNALKYIRMKDDKIISGIAFQIAKAQNIEVGGNLINYSEKIYNKIVKKEIKQ